MSASPGLRQPHCRNDIGIGAAAADVAAHFFRDVVVDSRFGQKRNRRHDLSGRTVTALKCIALDKCGLNGMEFAVGGKTFDGRDLVTLMHDGESETGVDPRSVDMN